MDTLLFKRSQIEENVAQENSTQWSSVCYRLTKQRTVLDKI